MRDAVLFLIFNRPESTARVFDAIRSARPPRLYVAADGPRPGRDGEKLNCEAARNIVNHVDWPCQVKTLFQPDNLGPMHAQVAAFNWFFSEEPQGIVLEDDCLPNQDFFSFCEELLDRYKHDQRVFMISGNNFQDGIERGKADYYFSSYIHIWGWAAWRRTWEAFDPSIRDWPQFKKQGGIKDLDSNHRVRKFWTQLLSRIYCGDYDRGWDYRLSFACWRENGLVAIPRANLVSNIGFGEEGTNCVDPNSRMANMPVGRLDWPLSHPTVVARNLIADRYTAAKMFVVRRQVSRAVSAIRHPARVTAKIKRWLSVS